LDGSRQREAPEPSGHESVAWNKPAHVEGEQAARRVLCHQGAFETDDRKDDGMITRVDEAERIATADRQRAASGHLARCRR
jgi:hypothetical protein